MTVTQRNKMSAGEKIQKKQKKGEEKKELLVRPEDIFFFKM